MTDRTQTTAHCPTCGGTPVPATGRHGPDAGRWHCRGDGTDDPGDRHQRGERSLCVGEAA